MKRLALSLGVLVLAAGGLWVYSFVHLTLAARPGPVTVIPAQQRPGEFQRWAEALEQRSVQGTVFSESLGADPGAYCFMVFSVSLRNRGFLPAEMAELQVAPAPGDVLCVSAAASLGQNVNASVIVPALGEETLQCILLTWADAPPVRDLYVSYYIWGHPFTVRCTAG